MTHVPYNLRFTSGATVSVAEGNAGCRDDKNLDMYGAGRQPAYCEFVDHMC